MTSKTPLLALTLLAACASSGTSNPTPDLGTPTRISGPDFGMELYTNPGIGERLMAVPLDSVWLALPGVYGALDIDITHSDPSRHVFGNPQYRARRVEGKRLSTYIDCGSGVTAVPKADDYEVTLSVTTTLTAGEENSTVVTTTVDGYARPRAVSTNPVHCTSKGTLELRVVQLIREALEGTQ